jgi:hypothetical protein
MAKYRVTTGLDYPPNKRAEAGDVVSDLPPKSIKWLREQGLIEQVDGVEAADPVTEEEEA